MMVLQGQQGVKRQKLWRHMPILWKKTLCERWTLGAKEVGREKVDSEARLKWWVRSIKT
jgi:hypothetical protein